MLALHLRQTRNRKQSLFRLPLSSLQLRERYFDLLPFSGCIFGIDGSLRAISADNLTDSQYFAVHLHPPLLRMNVGVAVIPARRVSMLLFEAFRHGKVGIRSSLGIIRGLERPLSLFPAAVADGLLARLSILRPAAIGVSQNTFGDEFHGGNYYNGDKIISL